MAASEERLRILRMVENKEISVEEAARLLAGVDSQERASDPTAPSPTQPARPRWFHVRITDLKTGKRKVNVNIPLGLVDVGLKWAKFAPSGLEGLDMDRIMQTIRSGGEGKIADVRDEKEGEHVEIFVE